MTKDFGFLPPELGGWGGSARYMGYPNSIASHQTLPYKQVSVMMLNWVVSLHPPEKDG
jgi:hypothetical protein